MKPASDKQAENTVKKSKFRELNFFWKFIVCVLTLLGLFLALNQIFVLRLLGSLEFLSAYMYSLIACFISMVYIIYPISANAPKERVPWYDIIFFITAFAAPTYLAFQAYDILHKGYELMPPLHIGIIGIIVCIVTIEALRRTGGMALFLVATVFAFYPTFADYMPGILKGAQFSLWNTAIFHALSSSSIIGVLTVVFAQLVIGFLFFGAVLVAAGGGDAFMNLALALLGTHKGGPAKVAIFASAIFGSISGSAVSNVISTGSFTIPAMKRSGYPAYFAGAIEACASTGGVIMPPVMGAAAFVMASFLETSYIAIVLAATIPAVLYYLGLYVQVYSYAEIHNLQGLDPSQVPSLKSAIVEVLPYLIGLLSLVYFLFLGLEGRAAFVSAAVMLALAMLRKKTRLNLKGFISLVLNAAKSMSNLLGMVAGIGFIVGSMSLTGVGFSFSSEIINLAGGNIALLLCLGALASFILGTGMTTTACYIFLAIVMAPALVTAGLNPLAVHLFVLYWGMASYITPPVALASLTAAGIAGSSPLKTGLQSMRLGVVIYLIPFFFVLEPALILQASFMQTIVPIVTCIIGVILIAGSLEGYLMWYGKLNAYSRLPMGVAGFLLAMPGLISNLLGVALLLSGVALLYFVKPQSRVVNR